MAPSILSLVSATPLNGSTNGDSTKGDKHLGLKGQKDRNERVQPHESSNEARIASGNVKETSSREHAVPEANKVQETAIPGPISAGSISTGTLLRTTLTISPTFSVASSQVSHLRSTTTVWIPSKSTSSFMNGVVESGSAQATSSATSGRLSVHVVVLLVIGAIGLALSAVIVLRCFLRRHGPVNIPRPSAPILQESPLFGGKERFSRGIWSDPSYLLNSHAKPEKAAGWRPLSGGAELATEKTQNKRHSTLAMRNVDANKPVSATLSPASVYTTLAPPSTAGGALDFPIPPQITKSVTQPLKIKDRGVEGNSGRRGSVAMSMYGDTDISSPTHYQASRPAPNPGKTKGAIKPSGSSRDNLQRPSRKNAPSRASQGYLHRTPSGSRGRDKEEPFLYAIPSVKDQERRDRDTKALTTALGLGSPPPPSSCFSPVSIYPDDSLSVAHGRMSEMPSQSATHSVLGDFMLQDFPSTATFNTLRPGDPFAGDPAGKKDAKGRVNDRPPRVPSPPPMPSLSQMALANADPDYRSPTYSIYGLYEAQRKSKRSSMGK